MLPNAPIFRWLTVVCLAVGMNLTGFLPQMLPVSEAGGTGSAAARPLATCCCGVEGRCCGMPCCVTRSPVTPETPLPASSSSKRPPNSFGFVAADAGVLGLERKTVLRSQHVRNACCLLLGVSLQSLQIRLDV